jgi:hypothetical protein
MDLGVVWLPIGECPTGFWVPSKSPPKPVAATVPLTASRPSAQVAQYGSCWWTKGGY